MSAPALVQPRSFFGRRRAIPSSLFGCGRAGPKLSGCHPVSSTGVCDAWARSARSIPFPCCFEKKTCMCTSARYATLGCDFRRPDILVDRTRRLSTRNAGSCAAPICTLLGPVVGRLQGAGNLGARCAAALAGPGSPTGLMCFPSLPSSQYCTPFHLPAHSFLFLLSCTGPQGGPARNVVSCSLLPGPGSALCSAAGGQLAHPCGHLYFSCRVLAYHHHHSWIPAAFCCGTAL